MVVLGLVRVLSGAQELVPAPAQAPVQVQLWAVKMVRALVGVGC